MAAIRSIAQLSCRSLGAFFCLVRFRRLNIRLDVDVVVDGFHTDSSLRNAEESIPGIPFRIVGDSDMSSVMKNPFQAGVELLRLTVALVESALDEFAAIRIYHRDTYMGVRKS